MQLRDLRCMVAVEEKRSLSRAATALRVSQPALSRQIRDLEREMGVALLERHSKGVMPTVAGEAFARGAAQVLATLAGAVERAVATGAGRRGRVVVGAMLSMIATGIPAAVEEAVRRDDPDITLVVQDFDPPDIVDQVRSGGIDIALTLEDAPDPTLMVEPLLEEYIDFAMLPSGHPLAARRSLGVADLGLLPLVIPQRAVAPEILDRLMDALRRNGLRSPLLVIDAGLRGGHLAVAAGRGWTLVGRTRAAASTPQGTTAVRLENLDLSMRGVAMWRKADHRAALRRVLSHVFDAARRVPEARVRPHPALPPAPPARAARHITPGALSHTLEVRHLRALLEVAATQTIGRAAERLGFTQPALSRQLKELEYAVGVALLERSARGVMLTPAGSSLAGECPALLLALEQIVLDTTRARRGMEGRCAIGAVATAATSDLLTRVLADCAARHPQVHMVIEELATPLQGPAIMRGDLDLGLAHAYPTSHHAPGLMHESVFEDRLQMVLLNPAHPLAAQKKIRPQDLADVPFLFMARDFHPAFYDRVLEALNALGLTPRIDATYDGLQAVWSMVAQGKGWVFGFRSHRRRPPLGTVAVPLVGFDLPWGLIVLRRRAEPSLAVRAVLESFRDLAPSSGAAPRVSARRRSAGRR